MLTKKEVINEFEKIGKVEWIKSEPIVVLENIRYKINYSYIRFGAEYKNSEYSKSALNNIINKLKLINDMLNETDFVVAELILEKKDKEALSIFSETSIITTNEIIWKNKELNKDDFLLNHTFDYGYNWIQTNESYFEKIKNI